MGIRELELSELPQASDPPVSPLLAILNRLTWPFRRGHVLEPHPATGFYTDTTVCIGCKACEVACKQWNQLAADGLDWTGNSYDNTAELSATSWRHVKFIEQFAANGRPTCHAPAGPEATSQELTLDKLLNGGGAGRWLMMSDVCKHCVAAPCQHACPTGAIVYNEFANVYIQRDICNGCSYCIAACPFGVITRSDFDGHSHKCTLCYDRQRDGLVPACAKACPTASIQFGPIDELRDRARKRVDELHERGVTDAYLYGDKPTETYTELHSFYLLVDRPATYGLPETPFNPWLHMLGDYGRTVVSALVTIAAILAVLFFQGR
jgi:formate dehydrogenase iron-sulfur subunit